MRLSRVEIEGYRSIAGKLVIHFDRKITVIMGANDHGKSNLLWALTHLNADAPYSEERDLCWDFDGKSTEFPSIQYILELDDEDRQALVERENPIRATEEVAPISID